MNDMTTFIARRIIEEAEKSVEAGQKKYRAYFVKTRLYKIPTEVEWKRASLGDTFKGKILPGSICYTTACDVCIMANDGTWGPWV